MLSNTYIELNGISINPANFENNYSTIAKIAGLHPSTVNRIMNQSRNGFKIETINKIRDAIILKYSAMYEITDLKKLKQNKKRREKAQ